MAQVTEEEVQALKPTTPVVMEATIVKMAASLQQLKDHTEQFAKVKKEILKDHDYADIAGKKYIKKSGWYTFAFAFNLKTEIIKEVKETDELRPGYYAYHFTVRCTASNGRVTEKVGTCDTIEKPSTSMHVIRSMAETRATNRAISAMVGGGEVSYEEINKDSLPTSFCSCSGGPKTKTDGKCKDCDKYSKPWWNANH